MLKIQVLLSIGCSFFIIFNGSKAHSFNQPVKLIKAEIEQSCSSCSRLVGTIQIENIAYAKNVEIIFQSGNEGWQSFPAYYKNQFEKSNYEVWEFATGSVSVFLTSPLQFAISYKVNGQIFWDNNCGHNYHLNMSTPNGEEKISEVIGQDCF